MLTVWIRRASAGLLFLPLLAGCATVPTASFSPDGSQLAIARGGEEPIYSVPSDGGAPLPLTGTEGGTQGVWSPDGGRLLFFNGEGAAVYEARVGAARGLAPDVKPPYAWSPDGSHFTGLVEEDEGPAKLGVVRFSSGTVEERVKLPFSVLYPESRPQWTEKGLYVLGVQDGRTDAYVVSEDRVRPLTRTGDLVTLSATESGSLVWVRGIRQGKRTHLAIFTMAARDGSVLRVGTPRLSAFLRGHGALPIEVGEVSLSPDGTRVAVRASQGEQLAVLSGPANGAVLQVVETEPAPRKGRARKASAAPTGFTWSPQDGSLAVFRGAGMESVRLHAADGKVSRKLQAPKPAEN